MKKSRLQKAIVQSNNYDIGVDLSKYPVNGSQIRECLNALNAWEYLTAKEIKQLVEYTKWLMNNEPSAKTHNIDGEPYKSLQEWYEQSSRDLWFK